jgi:ubiquinone/menaquinone biosynthesis C-methylase UbiE
LNSDKDELQENRQRYEARRKLFLAHGYDLESERAFIIGKARPISGKVLEVGTGKGHLTLALAQEKTPFTSVDLSTEDQHIARLNLQFHGLQDLVQLKVANAESLPFEEKTFDLIISANVLHHLAHPEAVFQEILRLLSTGGRIVVSDFNTHGLQVIDQIHRSEGGRHEVGSGTLEGFSSWLIHRGFAVERHRNTMQDTLIGQYPPLKDSRLTP